MFARLVLLFALVTGTLAAPAAVAGEALSAAAQTAALGRGLNVFGYDPLWSDRSRARFKQGHFKLIHDAGFQTLRVNLRAFAFLDADNRLPPAWFETLDWIVASATEAGLNVILDEHDFRFCADYPDQCRVKLTRFWQQVAEHEAKAPNTVVFELLNEPNRKLTPELWNQLFPELLAIVRKTNPERNVIVGPGSSNSYRLLDTLVLPPDDRHLIVTVHFYDPFAFTHQGAAWATTPQPVGTPWGSPAEYAALDKAFDTIARWSKLHDRPIFLGEFGAYDKAAMEHRALYTAAVARAAEAHGWSWAYWQFDSDFIVFDMAKQQWIQPLLQALVPGSAASQP